MSLKSAKSLVKLLLNELYLEDKFCQIWCHFKYKCHFHNNSFTPAEIKVSVWNLIKHDGIKFQSNEPLLCVQDILL